MMLRREVEALRRWIIAAGWVYLSLLLAWSSVYFTTGDRLSVIALVNNLAVYLFAPLPFLILVALLFRRWELGLGSGIGLLVFLYLWGGLFYPRQGNASAEARSLTVMTYNVLGRHNRTGPVIETIRIEKPDLVFIQELNTSLAAALQGEMRADYPFQVLDPIDNVTGMGVISRYPIRELEEDLPLDWVGEPQTLIMEWNGQAVNLVNFHMFPGGLGSLEGVSYVNRLREGQAQALVDFARQAAQQGPLIAAGDANVTSLSDAYRILTAELTDAWQLGGVGLGHTFPGSDIPGSARPRLAGWPVPRWLARIDYVFTSAHWEPVAARLARFDGVSDHRGVVAVLALDSERELGQIQFQSQTLPQAGLNCWDLSQKRAERCLIDRGPIKGEWGDRVFD